MVVIGIDVSKAMLDVSMAEGPVHRLRKYWPGHSPLAAAQGPCEGHASGVRGHRRT